MTLIRVVCIVEGHGDVQAVPILLRRIAEAISPDSPIDTPHPIRVPRSRLLKEGEIERAVELAARQSTANDAILILLDADDDCPAELAPRILTRAHGARRDRRTGVVLANREYEAWLLAAAESIAQLRGLGANLMPPEDPEAIRGAKEWLSQHMSASSYRETIDQAPLTARMDLEAARRAPSFDKLWRTMKEILEGSDGEL